MHVTKCTKFTYFLNWKHLKTLISGNNTKSVNHDTILVDNSFGIIVDCNPSHGSVSLASVFFPYGNGDKNPSGSKSVATFFKKLHLVNSIFPSTI